MKFINIIFLVLFFISLTGCKQENVQKENNSETTDFKEMKSSIKDSLSISVTNDSILSSKNKSPDKNIADKNKIDTANKKHTKIIAYYFHPTTRCTTCRNIEAYSSEAIEKWQMKNNRKIIWKELNIDDSLNEHYTQDYDLEFSSLVLAEFSGNKRLKWKNLNDTWKYANDKSSFMKYVNYELNQFIK